VKKKEKAIFFKKKKKKPEKRVAEALFFSHKKVAELSCSYSSFFLSIRPAKRERERERGAKEGRQPCPGGRRC